MLTIRPRKYHFLEYWINTVISRNNNSFVNYKNTCLYIYATNLSAHIRIRIINLDKLLCKSLICLSNQINGFSFKYVFKKKMLREICSIKNIRTYVFIISK